MVAPTGAGKTVMFAYVIRAGLNKGRNIAVVAHRRELVEQIKSFLSSVIPYGPLHVTTCQSFLKLYGKKDFDFIVVDEAHHVVSATYHKILARYPEAAVLGVTATPERLDGRGLGEIFEEMVVGPDVADLISRGFLSRFVYYAPTNVMEGHNVRTVAGDYSKPAIEAIVDRNAVIGDAIQYYKKYMENRRCLVFCSSVRHAENVANAYNKSGIPSVSIDGSMSFEERFALLKKFEKGQILVLTSCDLIGEGIDIPEVQGVQLLRPTKSLSLYLQQVGRALRVKPDASEAVILDHVGNVYRHGLPDERREWSLKGRQVSSAATRRCGLCMRVFGGDEEYECPQRGEGGCVFSSKREAKEIHLPEARLPEELNGHLDRLENFQFFTPTQIRQASGESLRAIIRRAQTREELLKIAAARGYKTQWVDVILALRRGEKVPFGNRR